MADLKLNLKKGDIVNFDMIRPGIFGDQYKNALVDGVVGYNTARHVNTDINQKHANFYPFFKDQVDNVDNPQVYEYLVIQLDRTKPDLIAIGLPWINMDTLKPITSRHAVIIVPGFQEYHRAPINDFFRNLGLGITLTVEDDI